MYYQGTSRPPSLNNKNDRKTVGGSVIINPRDVILGQKEVFLRLGNVNKIQKG